MGGLGVEHEAEDRVGVVDNLGEVGVDGDGTAAVAGVAVEADAPDVGGDFKAPMVVGGGGGGGRGEE